MGLHSSLISRVAFSGLLVFLAISLAWADDGYRSSYYKDGEIHVTVLGQPEGKPITSGHWDFKPSWSQTGDHLVFFRRLKNDPVVSNWITQLCIINADGTGFHPLSDGTYTDFNPTWTRDGKNTPVWNRKKGETGGYQIMASKIGGKPGEEIALTGKDYSAWVHSAVKDGRLFVAGSPPKLGRGYYLMTPNPGGEPTFERVTCELATTGSLDRVSISPDETKICFDYQPGTKNEMPGRTLYVADFDVKSRTITNAEPFANAERKKVWFDYPRWTKGGSAIVYHAGGKLFLYTLSDGSTKQVSTDDKADYRYPHGEATPN
jgi:Tol biopolymer transport system component